jgi:uncharacterized phiE125 gp8 family phage protein
MDLALLQISPVEPVSLEEAKSFLAVDHDAHDALISALIKAARESAEVYCNRSFVQKKFQLSLDNWPLRARPWGLQVYGQVKLPRGPVLAVTEVNYLDADGALQTIDAEALHLKKATDPAVLSFLTPLPDVKPVPDAINIIYETGYQAEEPEEGEAIIAFPEQVKIAIQMLVRTMYDHRDDVVVGTIVSQLPRTSQYLLNDYRIFEFM